MAITRRGYVFGTFLSSCVALVLLIVACATNVWISSDLKDNIVAGFESQVNYGLFSGTFSKKTTQTNVYELDIKIVCDFGENACAWSCQGTSEERKKELSDLLAGLTGICSTLVTLSQKSNVTHFVGTSRADSKERDFLNAALYLCTVITLMLALLATTMGALLAVINSATNPTRSWLAVESLYYWNGAAACFDLLCLILWGTHFATALTDSVGLNEVISGVYESKGLASLGWSYWMVFLALLISLANIGDLFWRDYLIRKEPPPPTWNPEKDAQDGTLILY